MRVFVVIADRYEWSKVLGVFKNFSDALQYKWDHAEKEETEYNYSIIEEQVK